jgi:hypothetical protein
LSDEIVFALWVTAGLLVWLIVIGLIVRAL